MITIILKSDGEKARSHIKGKTCPQEIMQITDVFCSAMIIALQNGGMSEDEAQCIIASAALSATGFTDKS